MPVSIDVIFTGLALFCLDDGQFCRDQRDTVYLVNASSHAPVCGRELDGGHRPLLSFDQKHLQYAATQKHWVVPSPGGGRTVVADLSGVELCACVEDPNKSGCREPMDSEEGAIRLGRQLRPEWTNPNFFRVDELDFDWVPSLTDLHENASDKHLCPQVEGPLMSGDQPNELVLARVRLDQGVVSTAPGWHDRWPSGFSRFWRRPVEMDFLIWDVTPESSKTGGSHFPKALPEKARWRIPDVARGSIVLLQDCTAGRPRQTLFRLNTNRGDVELHISNSPTTKHPIAAGMELEHFRWYYRLVDWELGGCPDFNSEQRHCPRDLPIPFLPESEMDRIGRENEISGQTGLQSGLLQKVIDNPIEGVLTQGIKCPPGDG